MLSNREMESTFWAGGRAPGKVPGGEGGSHVWGKEDSSRLLFCAIMKRPNRKVSKEKGLFMLVSAGNLSSTLNGHIHLALCEGTE